MYPLISITSWGLEIPTYLVINSLAFCLGVIWIFLRAKGSQNYDPKLSLDISLAAMTGGFVGARIFHIVFEYPNFYFHHPANIFMVWNGGFVFYGGLAGGALAGVFWCRLKKVSARLYSDLFAPVLALGYAVGRLGCFAAGCCYGKATDLPWAVHFPRGVEAPAFIGIHPTQIYSSLWSLGVLIILLRFEYRRQWTLPGQLFGWWLVLQSLGRAVIERFRDDFRGPTVFNLSISVWLSFVALLVGIKLISQKRKNRTHASTTS